MLEYIPPGYVARAEPMRRCARIQDHREVRQCRANRENGEAPEMSEQELEKVFLSLS